MPPVEWSVERRNLGFFDWRPGLVLGPHGEGWIGGAVPPGATGGLLYRWRQGHWVTWATPPDQAVRTFVLDVDPTGTLWVCPYAQSREATYEGLRVRRYDGRSWREEIVRPGIWPQTLDMVSSREGWIGGNSGELLHLIDGRWRREPLPLQEPKGRTILALKMAGPREGWLAGKAGLVARYERDRWRVLPVPTALRMEDFYALDVTGDGALWMVGTHGWIVRYDGKAWVRFQSPRPFNLLGLDMVSPWEGWAVGEYGTILRWNGKDWRQQPSPTLSDLYSVAMTGPREGWIAGNDLILRASARKRPWFHELVEPGRSSVVRGPGRKVAAIDANGDGELDLFSMQPLSMSLYGNLGVEGFFAVRGLTAPPGAVLQGFSWGDVEGDGDLDLLVLGRVPAVVWLYRNQGGLRFAAPERLAAAQLGGDDSGALVDVDRDGDLDLYLARSAGTNAWSNPIYHNDGAGRFQGFDSSTGMEGLEKFTLWGDLDGDLDLDAVLSGNGEEVRVLRNENGRLRDATRTSGLGDVFDSGQMAQGALVDLDLDGDLDLLLLGSDLYVLLNDSEGGTIRFHRDGTLFEITPYSNPNILSSLSAVGDLDQDGYPEVLLQPVIEGRRVAYLFSRGKDGKYHDVAAQVGLEDLSGNAAVFADWDGDGDLDLYAAGEEKSQLFENLRNGKDFLKIRLRGDRGNRSAVGARVRIYESGHLGEKGFLRGSQQAGVGFNPTGFPEPGLLHFGLDARRLYDVEADFPSGRRLVERSVSPGHTLILTESPPGLRQAWLAAGWLHRTWLLADRRLEGAKLIVIVLSLLLWRRAAFRLGARLLAPRWTLAAALLASYLMLAGALAADPRPAAQSLQILGFLALLGSITWVDRRLTTWKSSRYLGPYRLQELLGEGGMGAVHRARDVVAGRTVALKVLHPRMTELEEHRLRFLREARILTGLEHPNIVQVFDTGEIGGRGYICMELLAGLSLRGLVRRQGPLAPGDVTAILAAACDALAYVHGRGILHRDVKSDNLFILEPLAALPSDEAGWRRRVRLMDFGLARSSETSSLPGRSRLLGTLAYMPPEQLRGEAVGPRSDLYSLGVVAYEALTGRLPFEADDEGSLLARVQTGDPVPLRRLRPDVPEALARAVESLLARDPANRPASAEILGDVLRGRINDGWTLLFAPTVEDAEGGPPWRERFREARRRAAAGSPTEAQVLMVDCLAELKKTLLSLDPDQRDAYCRRHEVSMALDFMDRLSREEGGGN